MKAIVTGGAGFIGSHMVDYLISEGHSVVAFDSFEAGVQGNLERHSENPRLRIVRGDVVKACELKGVLDGADVVFHFAAFADLRKSLSGHFQDLETNVRGTVNLLEAMESAGVPHLVFSSTSSLYGEPSMIPTGEDYAPTQTSLYGASKIAAEAFAEAFTQISGLKLWTFRFSNVVGERCRRGIVWDFVHKLRQDPTRLEILGDGRQSKEFLYVGDCVAGMMIGYTRAFGQVNKFNLAIRTNLTPDEVADIVIDTLGLTGVERHYTGGNRGWIGDNPVVRLDVERISSLGWAPKIPSRDAIVRMVRWIVETYPELQPSEGSPRTSA